MASLVRESLFLNSSMKGAVFEMNHVGQTFSIREILSKPESFFKDKIFEIFIENPPNSRQDNRMDRNQNKMKRFKYVQLKIDKTKTVDRISDLNTKSRLQQD